MGGLHLSCLPCYFLMPSAGTWLFYTAMHTSQIHSTAASLPVFASSLTTLSILPAFPIYRYIMTLLTSFFVMSFFFSYRFCTPLAFNPTVPIPDFYTITVNQFLKVLSPTLTNFIPCYKLSPRLVLYGTVSLFTHISLLQPFSFLQNRWLFFLRFSFVFSLRSSFALVWFVYNFYFTLLFRFYIHPIPSIYHYFLEDSFQTLFSLTYFIKLSHHHVPSILEPNFAVPYTYVLACINVLFKRIHTNSTYPDLIDELMIYPKETWVIKMWFILSDLILL